MTTKSESRAHVCPTAVEKAARKRLSRTGYVSLGSVNCQFDEGTLILQGQVPSYYHKQVAQEAIRNVNEVENIINEITVCS